MHCCLVWMTEDCKENIIVGFGCHCDIGRIRRVNKFFSHKMSFDTQFSLFYIKKLFHFVKASYQMNGQASILVWLSILLISKWRKSVAHAKLGYWKLVTVTCSFKLLGWVTAPRYCSCYESCSEPQAICASVVYQLKCINSEFMSAKMLPANCNLTLEFKFILLESIIKGKWCWNNLPCRYRRE